MAPHRERARALVNSDPERAVAVAQLAIDIPRELGAREVDRLALTVRALTYRDGAASLLEMDDPILQRLASVDWTNKPEGSPFRS
jgi:hypothetical protein